MNLWVAYAALVASAVMLSDHAPAVDAEGYGIYRLGMSVNEVQARLADPTAADSYSLDDCYSIWRNANYQQPDDVRFLFLDGTLELVDIWVPGTLTQEKVGVGTKEETVRKAYAEQFRVERDHYDGDTRRIVVALQNSSTAYRFTYSVSRVITQVRVARNDVITLAEGCG